jgi:hypothetical protein
VVQPETPLAMQIGYGVFISAAHMDGVALCFSAEAVRGR